MEKYYFNRIYSLTVGFALQPNMAKEFSGLRCAFDVVKSEGAISTCEITINNLSDETRAWIKEGVDAEGKGGMTVVLKAGYEELHGRRNLPILFMGNIVTASHDVTKPEIVTHLTCCEGILAIKKSHFHKSYPAGVRIAQVINDAISAIGITTQSGKPFSFTALGKTDYIANRGYSFTGNAADLLDKIAQGYGLRWSVQSNKIKILNKFNKDKTPGHDSNPAVKGILIGSPKRLGSDKSGVESANFHGYEFDALLLPEAEIGGTVELSSKTIPNSPIKLVVAEIHHSGDSHGDDWKSTLKGRKL
jgi:hypothetical protein